MRNRVLLLLLPFIAMNTAVAKPLTAIENQITHFISEEKSAQISLLEKLVNINSGTEKYRWSTCSR